MIGYFGVHLCVSCDPFREAKHKDPQRCRTHKEDPEPLQTNKGFHNQRPPRTIPQTMKRLSTSPSSVLVFLTYCFLGGCFRSHAFSTSTTGTTTGGGVVNTPPPPRVIPVTVLSGFLGSGKTTLLQEMLDNKKGLRIGVVVNDIASVNIDSKLVAGRTTTRSTNNDEKDEEESTSLSTKALPDGMVELQNGCACCSLSDELLSSIANLVTLSDLRAQAEEGDDNDEDGIINSNMGQFHHIVIELSGVADPKAIRAKFQQAIMDQMPLMDRVKLDTMVSLIDCSTFSTYFQSPLMMTAQDVPQFFPEQQNLMEEEWMQDMPPKLLEAVLRSMNNRGMMHGDGEEADGVADLLTSQTETADVVVLNKQDLVDVTKVEELEEMIQALNPRAQILVTSHGKVPLTDVLGVAEGQGVAVAGAVDDHREYVQAVVEREQEQAMIAVPEAVVKESSHSHSHDHHDDEVEKLWATTTCTEPTCTDPSHSHSHSHDHHSEATTTPTTTAAAAVTCNEPECTDPSHSHSHSHNHHAEEESHSHSHSHDHQGASEVACTDPVCTDPTHDHSHSHDHMDGGHSHSHSHDPAMEFATHAGIGSFVYRARRPFHPGRLVSFLRYLPVVRGVPEATSSSSFSEEDSVSVPAETQKALAKCVRSKGFCWCADSHTDALYWSHAGSSYELKCLGQWWATLPRDQWPPGIDEYVLQDFDNSNHDDTTNPIGVGDRRQEVVFIGPTLGNPSTQKAITESLNQCILNDEEMEEYTTLSKANNNKGDQGKLATRFVNLLESKYVTY